MKIEEFNHIILPMRNDLKSYALRLTENDDNAEEKELHQLQCIAIAYHAGMTKSPEYHKRGSNNATTVRFPTSKNHRTFAASIRNN